MTRAETVAAAWNLPVAYCERLPTAVLDVFYRKAEDFGLIPDATLEDW